MAYRVAKSLLVLRDQVDQLYPNRDKSSDGTIAGDAHHAANPNSDHEPWVKDNQGIGVVTALDITHDPHHGMDSYKLAETLRLNKDPRVKYVISNRKIFNYAIKPWEWRPYNGSNPHDQHVHISVRPTQSLYDWETPWKLTNDAVQPGPAPSPTPPAPPALEMGNTGLAVKQLQNLLGVSEYLDNRGFWRRLFDSILQPPTTAATAYFGPRTLARVKDYQAKNKLKVDGIVGSYTWRSLLGTAAPAIPSKTNIVATVFGGRSDPNRSAYDNHVISDSELAVALPYKFQGERPRVKVTNRANGKSVTCTIEDVGPWNTHDPYWTVHAGRPQAESGTDTTGRKTNKAGIDLSPAAARAIGLPGKGLVDWSFVQ